MAVTNDQPVTGIIDNSGLANIAPAKTFSTSGAPVQLVPDVDPSHPAVDADPRAGTTVHQNKIDFNDPAMTGQETVEKNLRDQAAAAETATADAKS